MDILKTLVTQIEEGYEDGLPLHVTENRHTAPKTKSVFKIISEAQFEKMEHSAVQEILREQHIVITDMQCKKQNFEEALLGIAELSWITAIQGGYVFLLTWRFGSLTHIFYVQRPYLSGWPRTDSHRLGS